VKPGSATAIVTTLRNAGAVLDSFVAYHRAIGFAHLFLFFDDLNDPDLTRARAMSGVTAIPHDAALREAWRGLRMHRQYGAFIHSEVMARQLLNVEYAMGLARARGLEWLLSIDADELFFSPSESVRAHFEALSTTSYETIQYRNYEAVPVRDDIRDFFREVDLFKPPLAFVRRRFEPALRAAEQSVPQLRPYFHFYANGKSAVRLSGERLEPFGVHDFQRATGPTMAASSAGQFVLHYACCGFEAFWTKYATLGRFANKWFGQHDIASSIGTFHLEARDVVCSGDRDRALAFYCRRVAISDADLVDRLVRQRLLVRFPQPGQIIAAT
jgi:Glycosyl transferase family 2